MPPAGEPLETDQARRPGRAGPLTFLPLFCPALHLAYLSTAPQETRNEEDVATRSARHRRRSCRCRRHHRCEPGDRASRAQADLSGCRHDHSDRRRDRRVPGAPHLLHRPQLRRARARDGLGPEPRAAVLLPEADRRHPERRDRHGRRPSLSVADQELSLRGRAGGGAEIRRHQHPGGEGARPRLRLRASAST